jgi:hypothetical protein
MIQNLRSGDSLKQRLWHLPGDLTIMVTNSPSETRGQGALTTINLSMQLVGTRLSRPPSPASPIFIFCVLSCASVVDGDPKGPNHEMNQNLRSPDSYSPFFLFERTFVLFLSSSFFCLFYLILQRLPLPLTPSRAEGELVTIAWRGILIIGDGSQ